MNDEEFKKFLTKKLSLKECSPKNIGCKYIRKDWAEHYMKRQSVDEFWEWQILVHENECSSGWCILRDGEIVFTIGLVEVSDYVQS